MPIITTRKSADAHQLAIWFFIQVGQISSGIFSMAIFWRCCCCRWLFLPAGPKGNNKEKKREGDDENQKEKTMGHFVCLLIAPSGWQEERQKKREIQSSPQQQQQQDSFFFLYFFWVLGWYYSYGPSFPFWLIRQTAQVVCGLPLSKGKTKEIYFAHFSFWLALQS